MERPLSLLEAVPFLREYSSGAVFVVKAGGELLDRPAWRDGIARDLGVLLGGEDVDLVALRVEVTGELIEGALRAAATRVPAIDQQAHSHRASA